MVCGVVKSLGLKPALAIRPVCMTVPDADETETNQRIASKVLPQIDPD